MRGELIPKQGPSKTVGKGEKRGSSIPTEEKIRNEAVEAGCGDDRSEENSCAQMTVTDGGGV